RTAGPRNRRRASANMGRVRPELESDRVRTVRRRRWMDVSDPRDASTKVLPEGRTARRTAHTVHSYIPIFPDHLSRCRAHPGSITYMSPARTSLLAVVSLVVLTACVADAPRSGVSGGDVSSTPAPVDSAAPSTADSVAATGVPSATANTPSAPAGAPPNAVTTSDAVTDPLAGDSAGGRLVAGGPQKDAMSFACSTRAGVGQGSRS